MTTLWAAHLMTDVRTLGEIAARTSMLTVACSRCERRGRYRLDTLIGRRRRSWRARVIVPALTAEDPRRESAALVEPCDVLFPELWEVFPAR